VHSLYKHTNDQQWLDVWGVNLAAATMAGYSLVVVACEVQNSSLEGVERGNRHGLAAVTRTR